MGGKSPAIICDDADIKSAATRIAWGKWPGNMGQFCIATDYVLVVDHLKDQFVAALKQVLLDFYGDNPQSNPDVGRMISVTHAKHVVGLVDNTCTILHGGRRHDVEKRYVEPTIVEATAESTIMREEVFGPILSIVTVPNVDGAIQFVNQHFSCTGNHPLTMYVFAKSKSNQRKVMDNILSGMCCVNHVIVNGANFHLPFGGVGNSGINAYYGKHGFDFFSHQRGAVVVNNFSTSRANPGNWVVLPPYNLHKLEVFRFLNKVKAFTSSIRSIIQMVVPAILAVLIYRYPNLLDVVREFNINKVIFWIVKFTEWINNEAIS